jgi:hypothetical protein
MALSPNIRTWRGAFLKASLVVALSVPTHLFGALGGDATSVSQDQAHMKGSVRIARATAYTMHEIQAPTGTAVREYVSPAGKVFGVAWQGPFKPDLQQVLGTYYQQYVAAARQRRARGPVTIQVPGLVVQSGGHQRGFVGRAYVPEMLPDGVQLQEIK